MNNKLWSIPLFILVFGLAACSKNQPFSLEQAQEEQTAQEVLALPDPQLIFLQDYAAQESVIVRASGLHIKVLLKGNGAIPTLESVVTAYYHGTLIDGTVFDTTRDNGEPFSFSLEGVIDGWKEAIMLMRVGSIFEIVLPANLAYGDEGSGDTIAPGATLIFEVELIDVTNPLTPSA